MKNLLNILKLAFVLFVLVSIISCEKETPTYNTHYKFDPVKSIYVTFANDNSNKFHTSQIAPYWDTIWINFPPAVEEIDLSKVNIFIELNDGVNFVSKHNTTDVIDLTKPYTIEVANPEGSIQNLVIIPIIENGFEINTGINITYLFYMPKFSGSERRVFFNESDIQLLAQLGFDHIRMCIEEVECWDTNGNKIRSSFDLLHDIIGWCSEYDIKVIIDLHSTRNHSHTNKENRLFTDPEGPAHFIKLWMDFSDELSHYPNSLVAYELLNEPASSSPEHWNRVAKLAIDAIRTKEPERTIIIGPCHVSTEYTKTMYSELQLPQNDKYLMMTVHFYDPFLLTGYGFPSTTFGRTDIPIQYPGRLVPDEYISELPDVWQSTGRRSYNRESLKNWLLEGYERAQELNVPVFLGEFGSLNTLPVQARENWYKDVVSICNELNMPFTHFDYKSGGYSLVGMDKQVLHPNLVDILTK